MADAWGAGASSGGHLFGGLLPAGQLLLGGLAGREFGVAAGAALEDPHGDRKTLGDAGLVRTAGLTALEEAVGDVARPALAHGVHEAEVGGEHLQLELRQLGAARRWRTRSRCRSRRS